MYWVNYLPNTLKVLYCSHNELTELINLPNTLDELWCMNNKLTELNNLPNTLITLYCSNNPLTKLNNLPNTLISLYCINNQLTQLYHLPDTLGILYCSNNKLLFYELYKIKIWNKFVKLFHTKKIVKILFLYMVKRRCLKYKEELIAEASHPRRMFAYFDYETDDFCEYMENR